MQLEFGSILENISDAFVILDKEWRYVYLNAKAVADTGRNRDDLLGLKIWDLFPEGKDSPFYQPLVQAMERQETLHTEACYPPTGRWVEIRAYPIADGLAVYSRDITQRKRNQQELERLANYNQLLLESTGDGIFAVDLTGNCTLINRHGAASLGYEPDEVIGRNMHELTHHTRADGTPYPAEECLIYRAFREGVESRVSDEVFWRKDGTSFPVEYTSFPIQQHGNVQGAVVSFKNISERQEAERAVRESEARFRTLVQATTKIVWTTPPHGEFVTPQAEWENFTGQKFEDHGGWSWMTAVHPDDREETAYAWHHAVQTRSTFRVEHRLRRHDGVYRHMIVRAVPVLDDSGAVREWVGLHSDITEQQEDVLLREHLLESERQSRAEAEQRRHEALELARELQQQRDHLEEALHNLEAATEELRTRQEHQAAVTRYLRGANRTAAELAAIESPLEMMEAVVRTLHADFDMSIAGIWLCDDDCRNLVLHADYGLAHAPTRSLEAEVDIQMNPYKIGWVARMLRPYVSNQLEGDIQLDQEWIKSHGLKSGVFSPLKYHNELRGVMIGFSTRDMPLEAAEVISTLATILTAGLEKVTNKEAAASS